MADNGDDKNINNDDPKNTNPNDAGGGSDPKDGGNADPKKPDDTNNDFDPSTIDDDAFGKIFDDPRAFQHPRFKKLADDAKAGREAREALEKAEQKKLEEEGKFKELAETERQKREALEQQVKQSAIDTAVISEAAKLGAVDPDAVKALITRDNISVDENGEVSGVAEAVKALADGKGYLFKKGSGAPNLGGGNKGSDASGGEMIPHSKVKDPEFYRKNEADILKAMRENRIDYSA